MIEKFSTIAMSGRRSGIERRVFSYSEHVPERRSVKNRRGAVNRGSRGNLKSGAIRKDVP